MWAKNTFLPLSEQAVEQNEGSRSLVWVSTPQRGKAFFSVVQYHNCRPDTEKSRYYCCTMPDPRLDSGEEIDEEEDEEVSDSPLPAWLEGDSLAPPCQADMDVVRAIIDFAGVTEDDVLYDLGCGDGRICIEAAENRGAKACGVEIEENLVDKFRRRVAAKGLESKVSVVHGDLRDLDLSDATVLVMYLLPEAMGDIAQSHLLPFLRRGRCTPPREVTALAGDGETSHHCDSGVVLLEGGVDEDEGASVAGLGRPGSARCEKPFRIVCNTWGIPGATAVREAGVGMYGGVKLRLFTHESLAADAT